MQYEVKLNVGIDDVLNVWVRRWASQRDCRGYPSLQPFMRESLNKLTRYSISELDDQTYIRIDQAIEILRNRDLLTYQILMAKFLQRHDKKTICDTMLIAPRTFDSRLAEGRMFMEGAIFGSGVIRIKF